MSNWFIRQGKNVARAVIGIVFSSKTNNIKKVEVFGRLLLVYSDQYTGRMVVLRRYDRSETDFFLQELRKEDVCLDIGANIGYYTALFAAKAASVIAIEPVWHNAALVNLSAALNRDRHVQVIQAAVAAEVGTASFAESSESSLSGIAVEKAHNLLADRADVKVYDTPTLTVDSLNLKRLDIVKMDIEGYEFTALQGMRRSLAELRPRLLMLELVEEHLQRAGSSINEVLEFLDRLGYQPHALEARTLRPYSGQKVPNDNWFFIPR